MKISSELRVFRRKMTALRAGAAMTTSVYSEIASRVEPSFAYVPPKREEHKFPIYMEFRKAIKASGSSSANKSPVHCGVRLSITDPVPARVLFQPKANYNVKWVVDLRNNNKKYRASAISIVRGCATPDYAPILPEDVVSVPEAVFVSALTDIKNLPRDLIGPVIQRWLDGLLLLRCIGVDDHHVACSMINRWFAAPGAAPISFDDLYESTSGWMYAYSDKGQMAAAHNAIERCMASLERAGVVLSVRSLGLVWWYPNFLYVADKLRANIGVPHSGESIQFPLSSIKRDGAIRVSYDDDDHGVSRLHYAKAVRDRADEIGTDILTAQHQTNMPLPLKRLEQQTPFLAEIERCPKAAAFMAGWREGWLFSRPAGAWQWDKATWLGPKINKRDKTAASGSQAVLKLASRIPNNISPRSIEVFARRCVVHWDTEAERIREKAVNGVMWAKVYSGVNKYQARADAEAAISKPRATPDVIYLCNKIGKWTAREVKNEASAIGRVSKDILTRVFLACRETAHNIRQAVGGAVTQVLDSPKLAGIMPWVQVPVEITSEQGRETILAAVRSEDGRVKPYRPSFGGRGDTGWKDAAPAPATDESYVVGLWRDELRKRGLNDVSAGTTAEKRWAPAVVAALSKTADRSKWGMHLSALFDRWADFVKLAISVDPSILGGGRPITPALWMASRASDLIVAFSRRDHEGEVDYNGLDSARADMAAGVLDDVVRSLDRFVRDMNEALKEDPAIKLTSEQAKRVAEVVQGAYRARDYAKSQYEMMIRKGVRR